LKVLGLNVLNVSQLAGDGYARRGKVDVAFKCVELCGDTARYFDALEPLEEIDVNSRASLSR
jgi:hypothetical protein